MLLTKKRSYKLAVETVGSGLEDFLSKDTIMDFSSLELLHEAVTMSFPAGRLFPAYTRKRREEFYYKAALLEAALEEREEYLGKSSYIGFLDTVEKSAISYYMGMIFTKLIARRFFQADYLVHFHLLDQEDGNPFFCGEGKRRVELLGYHRQTEQYSLWVSKGRSNNSLEALREGARQAAAIEKVNGQKPEAAAVCMTYYEKGFLTGKIQSAWGQGGKEEVTVSQKELYRAYYTPIRELLLEYYNREEMEDVRWQNVDYIQVRITLPYFLSESGSNSVLRSFLLGIPRKIVEEGDSGIPTEADYQNLETYFRENWGDEYYLGRDFIYVKNISG